MIGMLHNVGVRSRDSELAALKAARLISAVPAIAYPAPDSGVGFARSIVADPIRESTREIPMPEPSRLAANSVTLESEAMLSDLHTRHARHGGKLIRGFVADISAARADGIDDEHGWHPAISAPRWRFGV